MPRDADFPPRLLTSRNVLLFIGALAMQLGIALRNPELLLIGATLVAALAASYVRARLALSAMSVSRAHPPRAFEGQRLAVELTVESHGRAGAALVVVEDSFPPATPSRVRRLVEDPLSRRESVVLHYSAPCEHRRGLYMLGPVALSGGDALGLFERRVIIEEFTPLTVCPSGADLTALQLLDDGTLAHTGIEMVPRHGLSEEFTGVREYRPGDSPRTIHWPTSARHQRLMVKEFEEDRMTEASVFLDMGRMGLTGLGDQTSVEYAIKAAASIVKRAIERSHAVQLFAIGGRTEHVPLGSGTGHLLALLDRLAMLKVEGDSTFLREVGLHVPYLSRGGTAVLLFGATTVEVGELEPLTQALLDRNIHPVIALVDDRAFIKIWREQENRHAEAPKLEQLVPHLVAMGADVHVITKSRSIEQALLQGLDRGPIRGD